MLPYFHCPTFSLDCTLHWFVTWSVKACCSKLKWFLLLCIYSCFLGMLLFRACCASRCLWASFELIWRTWTTCNRMRVPPDSDPPLSRPLETLSKIRHSAHAGRVVSLLAPWPHCFFLSVCLFTRALRQRALLLLGKGKDWPH